MAKVHPQRASSSTTARSSSAKASSSLSSSSTSSITRTTSSPAACSSAKPEVFTIWLKSLILGGKGCAVFDSDGQVVYRVDNYNCQSSDRVFLMDSKGKIICSIYRKKFNPFSDWEGYRTFEMEPEREMRWFQVHKTWTIFKKPSVCKVNVNLDHHNKDGSNYLFKIESQKKDSVCKIMDRSGGLIAEMKRKQSIHGIALGNDVQTLSVEPNTDPSLVMGLVVVHSLIASRM